MKKFEMFTGNKGASAIAVLLLEVVIFVGVMGGIVYWFSNKGSSNQSAPPSSAVLSTQSADVSITAAGFVPQSIMITTGQQVVFTNQDKEKHQVASDPYPTHTLLPDFISEVLNTNDSYSYTFEKKGTFTYHDELNPYKIKGTIIVK